MARVIAASLERYSVLEGGTMPPEPDQLGGRSHRTAVEIWKEALLTNAAICTKISSLSRFH
jgi:hypothetical protein